MQPIDVSVRTRVPTSKKSIPRHFVDSFLLPWCERAYLKKDYDEQNLLDIINAEIKRLDLLKLEASKVKSRCRSASVSSTEIKCINKGCKYPGLNAKNKTAVGICTRCGGFEHYECSKTKPDERDDIIKGLQVYTCTTCFVNNPSLIAFDPSNFQKNQIKQH